MTHKPLPTFRVSDGTCIVQAQIPQKEAVTLDSPALAVLTDLTEVRAATAHPLITLVDAERTMIQQGVRLLFVVSAMPCVDGIVTLQDLYSDKPLHVLQERRVRREQLHVEDVMTPLSDLDAVDYRSLAGATVGDIAATLLKFRQPYLIVIETSTLESPARVRGLVSRSQVERQLGSPLPAIEVASTFAEIQRALR